MDPRERRLQQKDEREQKEHLERWRGRIQNELLDLSTGSVAVPSHDNGHGFHYRSHRANLESGTCYIWFSVHVDRRSPGGNHHPNKEHNVIVMLDASTQIVVVHNVIENMNEMLVDFTVLYPLRPPRIQFISGEENMPKGSTIQKGDMMDWKWFRGGNFESKWSPGLRIHDAIELLAKSMYEDYCRLSRPFPPKEIIITRGVTKKICYFIFGCCERNGSLKKKTNDDKVARQLLNRLDIPEIVSDEKNTQEKPEQEKTMSPAANIAKTTIDAKPTETVAPPKDVNDFQDHAISQVLTRQQEERHGLVADEEEKHEIDDPMYHQQQ